MTTIQVNTAQPYPVLIGAGLLDRAGDYAAPRLTGRRGMIVSDQNIWPLYGQRLARSLEGSGMETEHFLVPAGEEHKTPQVLLTLLTALAEGRLTRTDTVFALGGGVVGDIAGLAASLYLRGIACVQIPTTLLAAVDSSVGGKTAVDLPQGKNLIGTFSQPRLVLCDLDTLDTLPPAVYAEGWAEVIKYGMIASLELLDQLLQPQSKSDLEGIIAQCVRIKQRIVTADERDTGGRQLLNFGHTLGHAIERHSGYTCFHGEGVALGMLLLTRACVKLGRCPNECLERLDRLLALYGLPRTCSIPPAALVEAAKADKKRRGDSITLVLPKQLGECVLYQSDFDELAQLARLGMTP